MLRVSVVLCVIWQIEKVLTLHSIVINSLNISLDDIFIAVKTEKRHQHTKLPVIFNTWFHVAKEQTWFFTDVDNPLHQIISNGHMIKTTCTLYDVCCKTGAIINHFLWIYKKWLCQFEDGSYVNVVKLVNELKKYNHSESWYLGRSYELHTMTLPLRRPFLKPFQYAYGKAGWCISRASAKRLEENIGSGNMGFSHTCNTYGLADDSTLGFMLAMWKKINLTYVDTFHSHLEPMGQFSEEQLHDQVTLSYTKDNVINVCGFPKKKDPSRFMSLHCLLFPDEELCDDEEYQKLYYTIKQPKKSNIQRVFKVITKAFDYIQRVYKYGKYTIRNLYY